MKVRICNVTAEAILKCDSKKWILKDWKYH